VRGFGAWFKLEATATAAFRAQMFVSLFGWVVPFAFMALWKVAAADSPVMAPGQTTAYYLVMLVLTNLSITASLIFGFGPLVYTGELSTLLMMPLSPAFAVIAKPIARGLIRALPLVVAVPLLGWGMGARFASSPDAVLGGIALAMLGTVAATMTAAVFALSALWFGKWDGIMGLFNGVQWVLGGLVAPSVFMPAWLAWTMRLSPLWAAQGGCAEALSGSVAPRWWMFAAPVGWIVVMAAAWRWAWPRAMRRFEAVGI
jgi:ABC-type uncharacterized transport system permease subunit